jgi:hypothetical protein
MDIELLITEIDKRPILWDASNELYKDGNKKNIERTSVANVVVKIDEQPMCRNYKILYLCSTHVRRSFDQSMLRPF